MAIKGIGGGAEWNVGALDGTPTSGAGAVAGQGFGAMLGSQLGALEKTQTAAADASRSLADGTATDPTQAIVAVERLYPLPAEEIVDELARYDNVTEIRWVQDEPVNQGAWPFMALNLPEALAAAQPELFRGVSKGVIHKNTASRKFERLTKRVASLG